MLDVYYASGGGFIEPVSYGKPVFIVVYKFRKNDFGADPVKFAQSVKKTGGTGFIINEVEVQTDGQPYISAAQLNAARRQCIDLLKAKITDGAREYAPEMGALSQMPEKMREGAVITASVTNAAQARAALEQTGEVQ